MQTPVSFGAPMECYSAALAFLDNLCDLHTQYIQETSPDLQPLRLEFDALVEGIRRSPHLPLHNLVQKLGATPFQQFALLLALAPELDASFGDGLGALPGKLPRPTLGAARELYALFAELEDRELAPLYDMNSLLNRYLFLPPEPVRGTRPALPRRTLTLRQAALYFLLGGSLLPDRLVDVCALTQPGASLPDPLFHRETLERAARFVAQGDEARILGLSGPPGCGKRTALQHMANHLGLSLLRVDCAALAARAENIRAGILDGARVHCYLTGAVPVFMDVEAISPDQAVRDAFRHSLLRAFSSRGAVILCSDGPVPLPAAGVRALHLSLPSYTIGERRQLWERFAGLADPPFAPGLDLHRMADIYTLTPGGIGQVVADACAHSRARGLTETGPDAVAEAVRQYCGPGLSSLAERVPIGYGWEDLCLEEEAREQLKALSGRITHRWRVEEQWGFGGKRLYGRGISLLLYGPPGTGKTMAAQVLAGDLGLDLYRIDLSRVVDKYIGETEKKLSQLFEAARDSNAILFFDEADVLFSRRTEVSDAKDRYANVETAYLLQRMESHDGISILATNIAQNFDEAFKRRITFVVQMPLPGPQVRRRLWGSVFPEQAPLAADAGLDFFAENFELSGSSIKNIAVGAAYLAAAEDAPISRRHIARVLREELAKNGRILMEHELY